MEQKIVYYFMEYENIAVLISLLINIVIAVLGVVPSVFVTGANLLFFGFFGGTMISFLGEAIGAIVAFIIYRKGLKKISEKHLEKYPKLRRLLDAEGKEAFYLILSLRLLPFIPSGLVTFTGAVGRVSLISFALASSLGKIPALLIEAYSVYQVTRFEWQGKLLLALAAGYFFYLVVKKR
ncbi:TVP38/TMEM64 family protein [Ammoniphilus sp. 3BR4]|uniref:TVP38/TMEM64 family protein n=1 Tax=Ammoniphilus sp. 3BR4 TaxID=3158265 RepID=UPI003467CEE6